MKTPMIAFSNSATSETVKAVFGLLDGWFVSVENHDNYNVDGYVMKEGGDDELILMDDVGNRTSVPLETIITMVVQ